MKRFTLLVATTMIATAMFGEVLTPDAAINRALSGSTTTVKHLKSRKSVTPELLTTFSANNLPAVYLFSRGDDNGYLVVSADDNADAILGYCDSGTIDVTNMPPAMKYLLESYAEQIEYARENIPQNARPKGHASTAEREPIHPMCSTGWGQGSPYNSKCPNQYPTGCVATAMAQVLKHFNYPKQGTGTYSYNWTGGTLSFNFDENPFDWDNMLDSYDSSATDAQKEAVANLMYACGVSMQMNYKSGGSGAYAINGLTSLVNYFGMDKGIRYYDRDYYGYKEWVDLIYDALQNAGPVMLGGCIVNTSLTYAHEFVCDGYGSDDLFHINWGWSYEYDGYFRLCALDPYSNGIEYVKSAYNYYQDALCYIQPPVEGSKIFEQVYCSSFGVRNTSAKLGNSFTLSNTATSRSAGPISGTLGVKVCDLQGEFVRYIAATSSYSNVSLKGDLGTCNMKVPEDMAEGTYTLTPVFRDSEGEWHDCNVIASGTQSCTMVVADGKATFSNDTPGSVSISDFKLDTKVYTSTSSYTVPMRFSAKVTNNSNAEYYGKVALALFDSGNNRTSTWSYMPLQLLANEQLDFNLYDNSTAITAGATYRVGIVDGSNNLLSDIIDFTVETDENPGKTWKSTVTTVVENAEAVDPHDIKFEFDITCTQGYIWETAWWTVYDPDDAIVVQWPVYPIALLEGETKHYVYHGYFPNAVEGTQYRMYPLSAVNGKWLSTKAVRFTVGGETNAVNNIAAESVEVLKTEYYNLQGVSLGESVSAPGLYIKVETLSDGERRSSRCIVR